MFTGIVRHLGTVSRSEPCEGGGAVLLVAADLPASEGDSVAVEGACLTVVSAGDGVLRFDVAPETLSRTTLGGLAPGRLVNLEPSLAAGDALGGHMVQGHVDGTAAVVAITPEGQGVRLTLEAPSDLVPFLAVKGSAAVNGVSLTVAARRETETAFALIPYTLEHTSLHLLGPGQRANLEVDIVARYLGNLLTELPKEAGQRVHPR